MNTIPSSSSSPSAVPAIRILDTDASVLLGAGDIFPGGMDFFLEDPALYACPPGLHPDYPVLSSTSDLEDIPELSYLTTTTSQPFLTGHNFSLPFPIQESDLGLSPSSLGSSIPSPTPSFGSSLSPSSMYDPLTFSDSDSLFSPSPDISDRHFIRSSHKLSSESLPVHPTYIPSDSFTPVLSQSCSGPQRARSHSSPTRPAPVASKAMLEANGRRRRHPAPFECPECKQTFTAQFSLKRHMQSHTGERPFQCSIEGCSQRFFNNSDCKRHEKSKKRHKDI